MKNILSVFTVLCIIFCSCSKDHVDNSVTPLNDSIYLRKFVALDTTQAAPYDTLNVTDYTYDNLHRVTTANFHEYDGTGTSSNTDITQYYYNGSDTLPYKSVNTYSDSHENSTDTRLYQYVTGTRNLSYDSSVYHEQIFSPSQVYDDSTATRYTYNGDLQTTYFDVYNSSGHQSYGPSYIRITRQNGNIVLQVDTTGGGAAEERYNCTYDTHKNPFYNVAWYSNNSIVSFYKYYPDSYGLNNNVTEINNTSTQILSPSNVETSHYKYSYKYRNDGYPLEIIMQDMGSTTPANTNKMTFFYTN